jgi:tetratricopeptide (TPR) repeat protein
LVLEKKSDYYEALLLSGYVNIKIEKYEEANNFFNEIIESGIKSINAYLGKAFIIRNLELDKRKILRFYDKMIKMFPNNSLCYNSRANYYREVKNYPKALEDIYKSLEINPEYDFAYATLAEINFCMNNINDFYLNFEHAVKFGFNTTYIFEKEVINIYKFFYTDKRFLNILEKYNKIKVIERITEIQSNNSIDK